MADQATKDAATALDAASDAKVATDAAHAAALADLQAKRAARDAIAVDDPTYADAAILAAKAEGAYNTLHQQKQAAETLVRTRQTALDAAAKAAP